ncbi:meteorin-like protein [Saccostrea cucullata]|uniref:meteorin-like protein n=1 Tax=Saccostrea cuccullata TaxID=36930 RepID=UPI002ED66F4D
MNFIVFGILVLTFPTFLSFRWANRCTIHPKGFIPDGEHREYQVPDNCTEGAIYWKYPKEYIIVNFTLESPGNFLVCLRESIGGNMFSFYDITGEIRLSIPKGTWPCINSQTGNASVEIHAPEMLPYLGAIKYSIQF